MGEIGSQCKPTKEEIETIIRWDDSGKECTVYTCNKALIARLDRYVQHSDQWKLKRAYIDGAKEYITTKNLITIREKTVKKELTEEQKQAISDRMRKRRNK